MSTTNNVGKTAEVANNVMTDSLTTINSTQTITSTSPIRRAKTEADYNKDIRESKNPSSNLGTASSSTSSSGGNDFFSGIARAITSAVNVAMTVLNPLSAVANAADTIAKITNKKA